MLTQLLSIDLVTSQLYLVQLLTQMLTQLLSIDLLLVDLLLVISQLHLVQLLSSKSKWTQSVGIS